MHRHGEGQVHLVQLLRTVDRPAAVKVQLQPLAGVVDLHNPSHVPVEHPRAHGSVLFFPHHIVVVPGLHHPVPLPEEPVAPQKLPLLRPFGVQRLLEEAVQVHRPGGALPGGGQHLDLRRRDSHVLRQAGPAQLHQGVQRPLRVPAAEEKEIPLVALEVQGPPLVHGVGRPDDGGLLRLAEDLPKEYGFHPFAADKV